MAKAVSERSLLVLDFLKENVDKNMTAADIGEALGLEKKSVDGIVTSGLCRKGLAERIPAEIELTNENGEVVHKTVKFIKATKAGMDYDHEAALAEDASESAKDAE